MRRLFVLAALCFALPAHAVTIDWVEVGDPGNACDPQDDGCFGSVAYVYRISKHEVTNAQYAEFLSAVAATDTYGLYRDYMGTPSDERYGGITRSGTSGSYSYSAIPGREDMPVNWVSFYDTLRFANWLHNGQPTGAQDSTTTEDGAYTFSGAASAGARNAGATIFLTSEDEWYKAAYFNGTSYFDYPAGSDTQTACASPGTTANTANCYYGSQPELADVGSYTNSASPYGTFDQGGNVSEWNEEIIGDQSRGERGGYLYARPIYLAASSRLNSYRTDEIFHVGFRVAMIPEPSTVLLLAAGLAGLAVAGRRRSVR